MFICGFFRHANSHFEDEQEQRRLATDLELAQQLALAPPSPQSPVLIFLKSLRLFWNRARLESNIDCVCVCVYVVFFFFFGR